MIIILKIIVEVEGVHQQDCKIRFTQTNFGAFIFGENNFEKTFDLTNSFNHF